MPTSAKSTPVFYAIQIGAVIAALAVFGGPLVYVAMGDPRALTGAVVGGTAVFLGLSFIASGAPRIYDASRTMTYDDVEHGYANHDGESVYVERVTGSSETTWSRPVAIRATITGLALCTVGLVIGLWLRL